MIRHAIVAGGGIAGHAAAIALRKAGIDVTVLEQRHAEDGLGSFLRLNPNGLDALAALDVLDPVMNVSFPMTHVEAYGPDGTLLVNRPLSDPVTGRGLGARFVTWTNLEQALRAEAVRRGATVRHGVRVAGAAEADDGVAALLADGGRLDGDVLIGADGTRSVIRAVIDDEAPAPEYCGSRTVYGYTPKTPADVPPAPAQLRAYRGEGRLLAHIDDPATGEQYWFTNLKTPHQLPDPGPSTDDWRDQLLALWPDPDAPAAGIIAAASSIRAADDKALHQLPRWHTDRLVVIGDAAHAAPPATEQGGAMALEDAAVLGQCLRDLDLPLALARFEQLRRDRVEKIIGLATGRLTTTESPNWSYHHHVDWAHQMR